jgi:hypothetical protein
MGSVKYLLAVVIFVVLVIVSVVFLTDFGVVCLVPGAGVVIFTAGLDVLELLSEKIHNNLKELTQLIKMKKNTCFRSNLSIFLNPQEHLPKSKYT